MVDIRVPRMKEIGSSGLHQTGGFILEEINPRLRGIHGMRIFREMSDNDPIIGGILWAIETLIRKTEWRVEPKDDTDAAVAQAEFMQTVIDDMDHTWEDFLSEVLTMLVYGWAYLEIVYKVRRSSNSEYDDGFVGWKKLGLRAQDSLYQWMLAPNGDILGMWQVDYYKASAPVLIPSQKALHFRVRSNRNNPEGRSGGILRNAYRPWFFTKRLQEFEAIGAERNLAGLPVMEVPIEILSQNAGPNEIALRTDLEKMIQEIKVDERMGALIPTELDRDGKPTGFKLTLLSGGSGKPFPIDTTINRYDKRIAQSVLAEFMMLGMDGAGSLALASTKTKLFGVALGSIMDGIASVINRFGVSKLMRLNNVPQDLWPKVVHGDIEKQPLAEISDFLQKMVGVGLITPTPKLERKLLEVAELGEVDDEAEEAFDDPGSVDDDPGEGLAVQPEQPNQPSKPDPEIPEDAIDPSTALNGAQVTALVEVMQEVASRRLPRDSAIELLSAAFALPKEKVETIMASVGRTFFVETPESGK